MLERNLLYKEIYLSKSPVGGEDSESSWVRTFAYPGARVTLSNELSKRAEKPLPFADPTFTLLRKSYIQKALTNYQTNPELDTLLSFFKQEVLKNLTKSVSILVNESADAIVQLLEKQFIIDPTTSSLDLLPNDMGYKYRTFKWGYEDFPGGKPEGKNEGVAREMTAKLITIRPERRPHTGENMIISESDFKKNQSRISRLTASSAPYQITDLGGQKHLQEAKKLNTIALKSFAKMREAAAKDGIPLIILSGFRPPKKEKSENKSAIADYSAHFLGLGMDLKMGMTTFDSNKNKVKKVYKEITTHPMQNVVDMRTSPVHKWLFMNGYKYGWYPYTNEPWHWEYNPEGFKDIFIKQLSEPLILFGPNANQDSVGEYALEVIKGILKTAGEDVATISSTLRTPADQARVMFDNIKQTSVAKQKELYGPNGDKVIDVYVDLTKKNKSRDEIIQAMTDKINELGATNVSNHIGNPAELTVVDIMPSTVGNKKRFIDAVQAAVKAGTVSRFIQPPKDPAYHIEIPLVTVSIEHFDSGKVIPSRTFNSPDLKIPILGRNTLYGETTLLNRNFESLAATSQSIHAEWDNIPIAATKLIIFKDNLWIISKNGTEVIVYNTSTQTQKSVSLSVKKIAFDKMNRVWMILSDWYNNGSICYWENNVQTLFSTELANDIAFSNDAVWIISNQNDSTNYFKIKKYNVPNADWRTITGSTKKILLPSDWHTVEGYATKIIIDKNNTPWLINTQGDLWSYDSVRWQLQKTIEKVRDFALGPNNEIWIIGKTNIVGGNGGIYKLLESKNWAQYSGAGVSIEIDPSNGIPYIINAAGQIWKMKLPVITTSTSTDEVVDCDSSEWRAIRSKFKVQKWDIAYVERKPKEKEEDYQERVKKGIEFKERIYTKLKRKGINPDEWYNNFTNTTFLGRRFSDPIHIEFATYLKIVEKKLAAKYGGPTQDPKKAGDVLQLTMQSFKGGRRESGTADFSMHTVGLAMDINYDENPYLGGTYKRLADSTESIQDIVKQIKEGLGTQNIKFRINGKQATANKVDLVNIIFDHCGMLINGQKEVYPPKDKYDYKKRLSLFDELQRINRILVQYFNLTPTQLDSLLNKAQPNTFWYGKDVTAAIAQIKTEWELFCGFVSRWKDRDNIKANGFIKLDRRFVDELGLDWGATYGDIMHFDMRNKCIGKKIKSG